ncbi:MAG: TolC family protein [Myxococcales bacterium]|nr:TolC family protein [Myxococcales bacterium]
MVAWFAAAAQADGLTLTIDEAIARVEPAAETLAAGREDLARARAQIDVAKAGRLPTVTGSASFQRTLVSEFGSVSFQLPGINPGDPPQQIDLPIGQRNVWRVGVNVTQPLYDGGRARSSIALARVSADATELGLSGQRTALVFTVAQAYWDTALAVRAVEIGEAGLASAEETLAQTQLSFANQAAAEFDVVRAQVARDNLATGLIQLAAQRDIAMMTLARLIDAPLDQPIALATPLEIDDGGLAVGAGAGVAGPAGAPSVAVAQAELDVAAREAALRLTRAERLPQVNASTDLGAVDYPDDIHPFNTDWRASWTIGVGVSVPIFDGFRRRATAASARREVAAARARLADVRERVAVDARVVDAQVAAATATWDQARRTVEQARRAFAIAELRFAQGASSHLELVDARNQLEQAELNRARSARDVRVATLRRDLLAGLPLGAGGP